jgi:PAS domain S-box-containing protein
VAKSIDEDSTLGAERIAGINQKIPRLSFRLDALRQFVTFVKNEFQSRVRRAYQEKALIVDRRESDAGVGMSPPSIQRDTRIAPAIGVAALAAAVFAIDVFTPIDVSVSVFYVFVILVASSTYGRNGILATGFACEVLTLLAHAFSPGDPWAHWAVADRTIAVIGIAMFTLVVMRNRTATERIAEQADFLNQTHDSIFVRDAKGAIAYWNRGSEALYGWTSQEALGKTLDDLAPTTYPAPLPDIMQALVAKGYWEGDLLRTTRNGKIAMVAARWSIRRDNQGRFAGVLETNNDITERRKTQDDLQRVQSDLARVTRATTMGQLAASISHEVNQPLTGVVTNGYTLLHWLNEKTLNLDKARVTAERVLRDGERASGVIQRIRGLLTKTPPQTGEINLNNLVLQVLDLLQTDLRLRDVVVQTELTPELPACLGDTVQLQQVLLNLVVNGSEAMSEVSGRPKILVVGSHATENGEGVIFVRDHGVGIDQETAEKIFDPFFTTKEKGMGMGLAICRSIVEAHGGRLWATPAEPSGALFQFALPNKTAADA